MFYRMLTFPQSNLSLDLTKDVDDEIGPFVDIMVQHKTGFNNISAIISLRPNEAQQLAEALLHMFPKED